jgi:hypothetical protein
MKNDDKFLLGVDTGTEDSTAVVNIVVLKSSRSTDVLNYVIQSMMADTMSGARVDRARDTPKVLDTLADGTAAFELIPPGKKR